MFARAFDPPAHLKKANGQPLPDNDSRNKKLKAAEPAADLDLIVADELRAAQMRKRNRDDEGEGTIHLGASLHPFSVTHLIGPALKRRFYGM